MVFDAIWNRVRRSRVGKLFGSISSRSAHEVFTEIIERTIGEIKTPDLVRGLI